MNRHPGRWRVAAVAVASALGLLVTPAGAQDDPSATSVLRGGEVETADFPILEIVVSLPGGAAADATAESFSLLELGQTITPELTSLSAGALDVVLAIDTSGSMAGTAIDSARTAAAAFLLQLPDSARIAVVGFGPSPSVASPLTADRSALAAALFALEAGGETALYDGVIAAADQIEAGPRGRTALVVLSDGGDTVSTAVLSEAAEAAADRFDVVHAVSLTTSEQDTVALEALVSGGGAVVRAEDPVALSGVYTDVADRIVNQYALRWETSIVDDASVDVRFISGDQTMTLARDIDLDDALVASLSRQAGPADAGAPDSVPAQATAVESLPVVVPTSVGSWVLWSGVVLVAAALLLTGFIVATPGEKRRNLASEFRDRVPQRRELSGLGRRFVAGVEGLLRRDPDRRVGLVLRLEKAAIEISAAEFVAMLIIGAMILALVGLAAFSVVGLVVLPFLGVLAALAWVDRKGTRRSNTFTAQLDSTLQLISGSLRSGFGIMQALGTVAEETEWPTSEEFTRVLGEVRLGRDLGAALEASARRIGTPDYDWAVQAIEISTEVGGNLSEVLDNVSQTIRQRNTLRRQVRSLSAEGRVSAVILLALPPLLLIWMSVTNSEYVGLLFHRTSGQITLVVAVALLVTGTLWMRRIVRIPF